MKSLLHLLVLCGLGCVMAGCGGPPAPVDEPVATPEEIQENEGMGAVPDEGPMP